MCIRDSCYIRPTKISFQNACYRYVGLPLLRIICVNRAQRRQNVRSLQETSGEIKAAHNSSLTEQRKMFHLGSQNSVVARRLEGRGRPMTTHSETKLWIYFSYFIPRTRKRSWYYSFLLILLIVLLIFFFKLVRKSFFANNFCYL